MRRIVTLLLAAVFALTGTAMLVSPASAVPGVPETGTNASVRPNADQPRADHPRADKATPAYKYWGFYQWKPNTSTWGFMKVGPGDKSTRSAADGSVYGFRYATVLKQPRLPRADGDFDAICGDQDHTDGTKRLAFVIDYGTKSDAAGDTPPQARGVCAVVATNYTVLQALQSVAKTRIGKTGLVCGIDGYPAKGCSMKVTDATEAPPDEQVTLQLSTPTDQAGAGDSGGGFPVWGIVVAAIVVVLLIAGSLLLRRQRA